MLGGGVHTDTHTHIEKHTPSVLLQAGGEDDDYEMEEELEQWLKKNKLLKKLEKVFARLGIDDMDMLMLAADEGHLSKEALEREGVKSMTTIKLNKCVEKLKK